MTEACQYCGIVGTNPIDYCSACGFEYCLACGLPVDGQLRWEEPDGE
jgi:hypothetical protein